MDIYYVPIMPSPHMKCYRSTQRNEIILVHSEIDSERGLDHLKTEEDRKVHFFWKVFPIRVLPLLPFSNI